MPDYAPVLLPGLTGTFTAAAAITHGDPLEVAGSGTVQHTAPGPSGLGSACYVGVAGHDAIAGARITVVMDRVVHEGAADGAINARDLLMASSLPGRQVKTVPAVSGTPGQADVSQARVIIGIALITAADGATVRWQQRN